MTIEHLEASPANLLEELIEAEETRYDVTLLTTHFGRTGNVLLNTSTELDPDTGLYSTFFRLSWCSDDNMDSGFFDIVPTFPVMVVINLYQVLIGFLTKNKSTRDYDARAFLNEWLTV